MDLVPNFHFEILYSTRRHGTAAPQFAILSDISVSNTIAFVLYSPSGTDRYCIYEL